MKRLCCTLIGIFLFLTGCGGEKTEDVPPSLYETASGIGDDETLLTVDGRAVPAYRYLYWLTYNCDYLDAVGALETGWGQTQDGQPLTEYVKEQALRTAVLYATIQNRAAQYGCALSDEDRQALEEEWARLCRQYGGEEECLRSLAWMGLDQEGAEAISADYCLYEQLYTLFCTGKTGQEAPAAETARQDFDQQLQLAAEAARVETTETYRQLDAAEFFAALTLARKELDAVAGVFSALPAAEESTR